MRLFVCAMILLATETYGWKIGRSTPFFIEIAIMGGALLGFLMAMAQDAKEILSNIKVVNVNRIKQP